MRWMAYVGLAAVGLGVGCASERNAEPIAFAVMQEDQQQAAASGGFASMVVERELQPPGNAKSIAVPTLIRVKGVREKPTRGMVDFRVLTAPIPTGWILSARDLLGPVEAAERWTPPETVEGTLVNSTPQWKVSSSGYALLWGWWPAAITQRVSAGTDGSTLLVVVLEVNADNAVEFIVLLEGSQPAKVQEVGVNNAPVYTLPVGQFIRVDERDGTVSITPAQPVGNSQPLVDLVKIVQSQRTQIVEW